MELFGFPTRRHTLIPSFSPFFRPTTTIFSDPFFGTPIYDPTSLFFPNDPFSDLMAFSEGLEHNPTPTRTVNSRKRQHPENRAVDVKTSQTSVDKDEQMESDGEEPQWQNITRFTSSVQRGSDRAHSTVTRIQDSTGRDEITEERSVGDGVVRRKLNSGSAPASIANHEFEELWSKSKAAKEVQALGQRIQNKPLTKGKEKSKAITTAPEQQAVEAPKETERIVINEESEAVSEGVDKTQPNARPEIIMNEEFSSQLSELNELGFTDKETALAALRESEGEVGRATLLLMRLNRLKEMGHTDTAKCLQALNRCSGNLAKAANELSAPSA